MHRGSGGELSDPTNASGTAPSYETTATHACVPRVASVVSVRLRDQKSVDDARCSFCQSGRRDVGALVIAPSGAAICNLCVARTREATEGSCGLCGKRIGRMPKIRRVDAAAVPGDARMCAACLSRCAAIVEGADH